MAGTSGLNRALNLAKIGEDVFLSIAKHLCVQDIFALSQTCTSFRRIILENKTAFINTLNFRIIPLPFGKSSAETLTGEELFARAIQAIALSRRLAGRDLNHAPAPRNRREVQYREAFVEPDGPFHNRDRLVSLCYTERHAIFISRDAVHFVDLLTGARAEKSYPTIVSSSCEISDSGNEIFIALQCSSHNMDNFHVTQTIDVNKYSLTEDAFGSSQTQITFTGSIFHIQFVKLQGDLVAFFFHNDIVVSDWRKRTALVFSLPPSSDHIQIFSLHFHPHKATVIVDCVTGNIVRGSTGHWLLSVDVPDDMPPLVPADNSGTKFKLDIVPKVQLEESEFSRYNFRREEISVSSRGQTNEEESGFREEVPFDFDFDADDMENERGHLISVRPSGRDSILDIIQYPPSERLTEVDHRLEHLAISLSDFKTSSVPITKPLPLARIRDHFTGPPTVVPNGPLHVAKNPAKQEVDVLRLGDEYHPETRFIRLKLPRFEDWALEHLDGRYSEALVGFDLQRGWLFFNDNDRVQIFEY
ncbi:hypothetical protein SISSUDRAFT_1064705 [Sistotremastrum suecicum HHB10207 ss-3]|uniref:F-box domain-containing protein n=1 Tax=Sistotremastrum suecicum HHB10207 ss-3 TaxID=1314776 RepID=A0A166AAZ2_9AGAM|nr:hypothetical protein SISSUDRAFT_1064705 [Sistotremastrum suecicum HHB10207 ss-3]